MKKARQYFLPFLVILAILFAMAKYSFAQAPTDSLHNKYKLALVLGGGAALGYAHLGAIKVLKENGLSFDLIVGTSIGAIVGGHLAAGIPVEKLIVQAKHISMLRLIHVNPLGLGFISWKNTEKHFRGNLHYSTFSDLKTPFAAVATDIYSGKKVVLDSGDVVKAMLASASIPGIYTPVAIDGHLLVDGGVVEDLPTLTARALGAQHIIAIDVHHPLIKEKIKTPFDVIRQAIYITQQNHVDELMEEADIVIRPDLYGLSYMDFDDVSKGVEVGATAARKALPQIRALLDQINSESK